MFYSVMDDTLDLIALAQLRLERAKISSLPNTSREQALNILHGVHPAPPRKMPSRFFPEGVCQ